MENNFKGIPIVLTAPVTEMAVGSGPDLQTTLDLLPRGLETVLNYLYPQWNNIPNGPDGSALVAPTGLRLVCESFSHFVGPDCITISSPLMLNYFIGPMTRIVYISIEERVIGSIRVKYRKRLFKEINRSNYRKNFKLIVGGRGVSQLIESPGYGKLKVDSTLTGEFGLEEAETILRHEIAREHIPYLFTTIAGNHSTF
jgi:hypothetical protein